MLVKKTKPITASTRRTTKKAALSKGGVVSRRVSKQSAIKSITVEVTQSDYLNHYVSPHLIDLKPFGRSVASVELPMEESVETYFNPSSQVSTVPEAVSETLTKQKIEALRREIAAMLGLKPEITPAASAVGRHWWQRESASESATPTSKLARKKAVKTTAAEPPLTFTVRQITEHSVGLTKQVIVVLDQGVNRLVEPLRLIILPTSAKALLAFVVAAVLLVLPIGGIQYYRTVTGAQSTIISTAQAAADTLRDAGGDMSNEDLVMAGSKFNVARQQFHLAAEQLQQVTAAVAGLVQLIPMANTKLDTAKNLLIIGQATAQAGQQLTDGLTALEQSDATVVEKVVVFRQYLDSAQPALEAVAAAAPKVDISLLPLAQQIPFVALYQKLPTVIASVKRFAAVSRLAEQALGQQTLKRYLVIFQNNHEVRPTGGFIGSYALVDVVNGEIIDLEIPGGGSYDLQGSLRTTVAAPAPLRLINDRWEFQDSNWFPDFPTAAKKILWFYQQAGGPTVDGVVAINASVMEQLLAKIGSVSVGDKTVTAESFFPVVQKAVELEYDRSVNQPKAIIADLAPMVINQLLHADREQLLGIMGVLNRSLQTRDVQFFFTDIELQNQLTALGWDNGIRTTDSDYLMVINSNIAGQKTDAVINQQVFHAAAIADDGQVTDTVQLIRYHQGVAGELFTGVRNVDYVRFYVPAGSVLVSATGFEEPPAELFGQTQYQQDQDLLAISGLGQTDATTGLRINDEFGKTVFGGWVQVDPGESAVATIIYRLPFRVTGPKVASSLTWLDAIQQRLGLVAPTAHYGLLVQKQSGVEGELYTNVTAPVSWQVAWQYPAEPLRIASQSTQQAFDQDQMIDILYTR